MSSETTKVCCYLALSLWTVCLLVSLWKAIIPASNPLSSSSSAKFSPAMRSGAQSPLRWSQHFEIPPLPPLIAPAAPPNLCGSVADKNTSDHENNTKDKDTTGTPRDGTTNTGSSSKHRVHLVLHSHMDFGWQQSYRTLFASKGGPILQTVLSWTHSCPAARFSLADGGFMHLLWPRLTDSDRDRWRQVMADGRVELLGGLPVAMSDMAASSVEMLLAAYREGGRFLRKEKVVGRPRETAWYIDPFGTSKTMMRLVGELGMKNLFIMRVDDATKQILKRENKLNFKWKDNVSNNTLNIFILPEGYAMDKNLESYYKRSYYPGQQANADVKEPTPSEIKVVLERLIARSGKIKHKSKTNQTVGIDYYGDDFSFDLGFGSFIDIQNFIHAANKYPEITNNTEIKLSTVQEFLDEADLDTLPEYEPETGDLFPYFDVDPKSKEVKPWTGYFATRMILKKRIVEFSRLVKTLNNMHMRDLLRLGKKNLQEFSPSDRTKVHAIEKYYWMIGGLTHHDAITGTCTAITAKDYRESIESHVDMLSRAFSEDFSNSMLQRLSPAFPFESYKRYDTSTASFNIHSASPNLKERPSSNLLDLQTMPLDLDKLVGSASKDSSIILNVVSTETTPWVLRVATADHARLLLVKESTAADQILPRVAFCGGGVLVTISCIYEFVIPPNSLPQMLVLKRQKPNQIPAREHSLRKILDELPMQHDQEFCLSPGVCWVVKVADMGLKIALKQANQEPRSWRLGFRRYKYGSGYSESVNAGSASGAYVFDPVYKSESFRIQEFRSIVTKDAVYIYAGVIDRNNYFQGLTYLMQVELKSEHKSRIEVRYFVQNPNIAKTTLMMDLTVQYTLEGAKNPDEQFYTDSNGLEFVKRKLLSSFDRFANSDFQKSFNSQKDIGLNYYPVSAGIKLEGKVGDSQKPQQIVVAVDRPHGGTLLADDTLELMVMRISPFSDGKGVDEPVMDEGNFDFKHTLYFGPNAEQNFRLDQVANTQKPVVYSFISHDLVEPKIHNIFEGYGDRKSSDEPKPKTIQKLLEFSTLTMYNETHAGLSIVNYTADTQSLYDLESYLQKLLGPGRGLTSTDFHKCTPDFGKCSDKSTNIADLVHAFIPPHGFFTIIFSL